jgi:predicted ribosomally synthesized peptide with nif11-like leader
LFYNNPIQEETPMSVENVKKFYQRLEEDDAFRVAVANENALNDAVTEKIIAVAGKHGYEFTETEYAAAMENSELSVLIPSDK